jgi:two-component system response regulator FixJ
VVEDSNRETPSPDGVEETSQIVEKRLRGQFKVAGGGPAPRLPGTTVFLIDDEPAVLGGLETLLQTKGLSTRSFRSAGEFFAAYDPGAPGCLISDVRLPDMNGIEILRELARREAAIPVVLITGHGDVPTAVEAMAAGAIDFLEKPFREDALFQRLEKALVIDARRRFEATIGESIKARQGRLTTRERQVMDLLVAGQTTKAIARHLGISPKTVEKHRAWVMEKMRASSICDLVQMKVWLEGCDPAALIPDGSAAESDQAIPD